MTIYGYLCESHPPGIKEVMSEWDIDRSGTVNVVELSAAAQAHKKVKEEGGPGCGTLHHSGLFSSLFLICFIILVSGFVTKWSKLHFAKRRE